MHLLHQLCSQSAQKNELRRPAVRHAHWSITRTISGCLVGPLFCKRLVAVSAERASETASLCSALSAGGGQGHITAHTAQPNASALHPPWHQSARTREGRSTLPVGASHAPGHLHSSHSQHPPYAQGAVAHGLTPNQPSHRCMRRHPASTRGRPIPAALLSVGCVVVAGTASSHAMVDMIVR